MIAFSAGGRRAATWRLLNPPHEMPIIPIEPVHHACAAIQRMHLERVVLLLRLVLVGQYALGVAAAADVDAHAGVAACRRSTDGAPSRRWR